LAKLPVHHQSVFGITTTRTPIGDAFIDELHKWNSEEAPLNAIPADLNFIVERTGGDPKHGGQQKNVTLNVRDTVAMLREYYTKELYAFETADGMPLKRRENYYPKNMTADTVRKQESNIRAALAHPIVNRPMWTKDAASNDVLQNVSEPGWEPKEIDNFINSYLNGTSAEDRPFAAFKEIGDKAKRLTGRVSLFDEIQGASHTATKTRQISDARWNVLQFATEADPASLLLKRSNEAAKARAMDHKFGSWVVVGQAGPNVNYNFSLMTRAQYTDYVAKQYGRTHDAIVKAMGHPNLTDAEINSAKAMGGLAPGVIRGMIAARKAVVAEALDAENMDPRAIKSREIIGKLTAALDNNYYSPVANIEAALANGEDQGTITQAQVLRIKRTILPAMFGRLGQDEMSASWRASQAYLMSAMNVVFLPLAIMSSLSEVGQIGIRMYDPILGKNMWQAQGDMLRNIGKLVIGADGKHNTAEADIITKQLGIVISTATESATSASVESEFIPSEIKRFNQKFFELTLLKQWTDFTRRLAYMCAKDAMRDYATKAAAGNPEAIAQAKVLGLDINAANTLADSAWIQTENFQHAVYTWIEEATLRPGPDTRPARMSDPRFALIWYLKDFSWAMQARTISYVVAQSKLQPDMISKMAPWIAAAIPMMIAGSVGAYLRDLLTNQGPAALLGVTPVDRYKTSWDAVSTAITRSGLLGPSEMLFQFFSNYEHRGIPWISQVSPVASVLQDMAQRGSAKALRDKLPGLSVFSKPIRDAVLSSF
jgi:hypothetical protein